MAEADSPSSLRGFLQPDWVSLNRLGKSRLLRSSYFWFFAVPVVARLIAYIPESSSFATLRSLSIPLSWQLSYYAAVAFSGASALYQWFSPNITREFSSFTDFLNQGKGSRQLMDYFIDVVSTRGLRPSSRLVPATIVEELLDFAENPKVRWELFDTERKLEELASRLWHIKIADEDLGDAFWFVWRLANWSNPVIRLCCLCLYAIGFLFLSVFVLDNLQFVVRYTIDQVLNV